MKRVMVSVVLSLFLSFGSLPLFWPLPETGNVHAATKAAPSAIPGAGSTGSTGSADSAAALNNYLQSQQQKKQQAAQQQQAQQQQTATAQNTKLVWPWWLKVFSGAMVMNAILAFFALSFSLAALWKWLALRR